MRKSGNRGRGIPARSLLNPHQRFRISRGNIFRGVGRGFCFKENIFFFFSEFREAVATRADLCRLETCAVRALNFVALGDDCSAGYGEIFGRRIDFGVCWWERQLQECVWHKFRHHRTFYRSGDAAADAAADDADFLFWLGSGAEWRGVSRDSGKGYCTVQWEKCFFLGWRRRRNNRQISDEENVKRKKAMQQNMFCGCSEKK